MGFMPEADKKKQKCAEKPSLKQAFGTMYLKNHLWKGRTELCCQIWNKPWITPGWHLRNRMKQKKQRSCWKSPPLNTRMSPVGHPVIHVPGIRQTWAHSSLSFRGLTVLKEFTAKKVLPPSGATPHLWETGKARSPTWILQLRLPQNPAQNSILCTRKREGTPSTETSATETCVDVHENREENTADPIFRSSKETLNFG